MIFADPLQLDRHRALASSAPAVFAPATRPRSTAQLRVRGAALLAGSLALLCACTKVNVTPLGMTQDGRRQYEISCNRRATDNGSCHEKAVALCGGSYETQIVSSALAAATSYNGHFYSAPPRRVLLIACNAERLRM